MTSDQDAKDVSLEEKLKKLVIAAEKRKNDPVSLYKDQGEIYCITNRQNQMKYIGQTKCIKIRNGKTEYKGYEDRFQQHLANALSTGKQRNACEKFYNAIREFGKDAFYVQLLERCSLEDLNKRERYYIRKYKTRKQGYNMDAGGVPRPGRLRRILRNKKKKGFM